MFIVRPGWWYISQADFTLETAVSSTGGKSVERTAVATGVHRTPVP
jgi:hypothetical protein